MVNDYDDDDDDGDDDGDKTVTTITSESSPYLSSQMWSNVSRYMVFKVVWLSFNVLFLHVFTVPVWGGLAYGGMVFSNI